jgi:2-oxoglutarate/2-oxoacid ferredoxin oxidoreductase subunit alpha
VAASRTLPLPFGNDLATLPSFPAEIRAPAGTLPGVSSFQVQIADFDILTAGDQPDCLVAMNPAALKSNLADLRENGTIIVNEEAFEERNLAKAGYKSNPLTDGSLAGYKVIEVPMERLTKEAVAESGVSGRDVLRSKNFFALGLLAWLFNRPQETTLEWIAAKFKNKPEVGKANELAFKAGYTFGFATEATRTTYLVKPARLTPGTYTQITGNTALAWGLIAAARAAKLPLFYGTYPITPASDVLHELSKHKNFGVRTFQAEDEIAGIGAAIGAAFGGALAVTGSSGPGIALKSEAISLALMTELPSTGAQRPARRSVYRPAHQAGAIRPPVLALRTPRRVPTARPCGSVPIGCVRDRDRGRARIAIRYMTPVILLSDNLIANGSEPWRLPSVDDLPDISVPFATKPNGPDGSYLPYERDIETFSRPWAVPGTAGLEHRIGGLEKAAVTGNVSYDPDNHQLMTDTRHGRSRASPTTSPLSKSTATTTQRCSCSVGAPRSASSGLRATGTAGGPQSCDRSPATPQPFPLQPRRGPEKLSTCSDTGIEQRAAAVPDPGQLPAPGGRHQPGLRRTLQGRRNRTTHPGDDLT